MSIARINEFRAIEGSAAELLERIKSLVPEIEAAQGCLSCQLLQSQRDPNHIVVIEVWDDIEAHQLSLKNVSSTEMHDMKNLFAAPPTGEYYMYCHT